MHNVLQPASRVLLVRAHGLLLVIAIFHAIAATTPLHGAERAPKVETASVAPKWSIIPHTESPDGRYAIAWGMREQGPVWDSVVASYREQDRRDFDKDAEIDVQVEDVENYLIDLRTKSIAFRFAETTLAPYWQLPHLAPNRHSLDVVWTPDSSLVVLNRTMRWDCYSCGAILFEGGKPAATLDLTQALRTAALRFAKSSPGAKDFEPEELNVSFAELKHIKDTTFRAEAHTVSGKMWAARPGLVEFAITRGKKGPEVNVLRVRKLP